MVKIKTLRLLFATLFFIGQAHQILTRYTQRKALEIVRFQGLLSCIEKKDADVQLLHYNNLFDFQPFWCKNLESSLTM